MRPFMAWPLWALVFFIAVLRRVGVLPRMLWRAELELFQRDVVEWVDTIDVMAGWRCAPIRGVQ